MAVYQGVEYDPATSYINENGEVTGYFGGYNVADYGYPGAFYPASPFYPFAAETGHGGGDTSLSSDSNAGYGGGYADTGYYQVAGGIIGLIRIDKSSTISPSTDTIPIWKYSPFAARNQNGFLILSLPSVPSASANSVGLPWLKAFL
jgi:hypothetical protein